MDNSGEETRRGFGYLIGRIRACINNEQSLISREIWGKRPWMLLLVLAPFILFASFMHFQMIAYCVQQMFSGNANMNRIYYILMIVPRLRLEEMLILAFLGWRIRRFLGGELYQEQIRTIPTSREDIWDDIYISSAVLLFLIVFVRGVLAFFILYRDPAEYLHTSPTNWLDHDLGVMSQAIVNFIWFFAKIILEISKEFVPLFVGLNLASRGRNIVVGLTWAWVGMFLIWLAIFLGDRMLRRFGFFQMNSPSTIRRASAFVTVYWSSMHLVFLPVFWKLSRHRFVVSPLAVEEQHA